MKFITIDCFVCGFRQPEEKVLINLDAVISARESRLNAISDANGDIHETPCVYIDMVRGQLVFSGTLAEFEATIAEACK